MKNIYLLRHGEIARDDDIKRYISQTDYPLSRLGVYQAEKWQKFFLDKEISKIYTSPLRRCFFAASNLAKQLNLSEPIISDKLMEIYVGEWENKSFDEIMQTDEALYRKRGENPEIYSPPGGETLSQVSIRLSEVLKQIVDSKADNIVIITHKTIIRLAIAMLNEKPLKYAWNYKIPFGSITKISYYEQKYNIDYLAKLPNKYPDFEEIKLIWQKYKLPEHIEKHQKAVAKVALIIAKHLVNKGQNINISNLVAAALLHDTMRLHKNHEQMAVKEFEIMGYDELANIIKHHNDKYIEENLKENLKENPRKEVSRIGEEKILNLADKYTLEDKFVDIDTRFEKSLKKCKTDEAKLAHGLRKKISKQIEKQILKSEQIDLERIKKEVQSTKETEVTNYIRWS